MVAVCQGNYDAVEYARQVSDDTPSAEAGSVSTKVRYTTDFKVGFGSAPGDGWTIDQQVDHFEPDRQYFVYAAVTGSRWTALPVDFSTRTLGGLRPDRVTWDRTAYTSPAPATMVPLAADLPTARDFSPTDEFHYDACSVINGY